MHHQHVAVVTVYPKASCQCVKCQCCLHLPYCSWQKHTSFVYKQRLIQTLRLLVLSTFKRMNHTGGYCCSKYRELDLLSS